MPVAQANWLSRLGRIGAEVGEVAPAAGKLGTGKIGVVELELAAAHIRSLPAGAKGAVLAAHATPEGTGSSPTGTAMCSGRNTGRIAARRADLAARGDAGR